MPETTQTDQETSTEQETNADQETSAEQQDTKTTAQSAEFSEVAQTEGGGANTSIDILLDMNLSITIAIGTAEIPIREFLQLGPGSVVKLDKPIDAPADLYLEGNKFATGTIVVVDDRFAIRVDNILAPVDSEAAGDKA